MMKMASDEKFWLLFYIIFHAVFGDELSIYD